MNIGKIIILIAIFSIQTCMGYQPPPNDSANKKAIVVGAGLAGLTAAYRLQQAGYQVDVYEARGRPGGRVYTVPVGSSYAELGGQSLEDGGEAKTIRNLIHEMGLSVETAWQHRSYSHSFLFNHHFEDGLKLILEAPKADEILWNQMLTLSKQSQNLGEVLDRLFEGKDPKLRIYFEKVIRGYEGSDTKNLSVSFISWVFGLIASRQERALAQAQGRSIPFSLTHVKGGNSQLVAALVEKLKGCIHYHSILTRINRHKGKIQLHFGQEKIIETDCVVLALPCSTLRDVEIEEGLFPSDQLDAIRTLHYGTVSKILVPIRLPSPPQPEIFGTEHFISWFNHDYAVLILYYGGSASIFPTQTQEEMTAKFLEELPYLQLAYPTADFPRDIYPIGISWFHEEFSKGSYSTLGVKQEEIFQNYVEISGETVKLVFRPIQNQIFFAGEHTSIDYPATLEGAVESGEKASRLILSLKPLNSE